MASKQMIAQTLASIKQIYPNLTQDEDVSLKAGLWEKLLKDYSDEQVSQSLYQCLQELKYPPVPADIVEKLRPNKSLLWNALYDALCIVDKENDKYQYASWDEKNQIREKITKIWNELPCEVQTFVGSKSRLVEMSMWGDTQLQYEKNIFYKADLRPNRALLETKETKLIEEE